MAWLTTSDPLLATLWPDAPDDPTLDGLLGAAEDECRTFLGGADPAEIKDRHKIAVILHARAIARSAVTGGGDQLGPDGVTVTVYPMDRTVKRHLRPQGVPVVR